MSKKSLIKSASIISGATLLSRILGFTRDILIAKTFGTGWFAQAFFVAFKIPNMFRDLAGEGATNAALVPVFSQYLSKKSREDFWGLVNTTLVALIIIVTFITLIGVILSPFLIRLIAPGFIEMPEKLALTVSLNRFLFVYLIFVSITVFIMGVLYVFKSFLVPSLFPCVFNLVLIISVLLADNSIAGIWKLVAGVIIAGVLQIIIQMPTLFKHGFKIRPFIFEKKILTHPGVRKIGRLLVPRIVGTALYQLNILVDTVFASFSLLVGPGAIAAIYYATRLIQFPLSIFGHSISNASLPTLSELAAEEKMHKFAEMVEFSLTNILFIMIPASFGLIVMSEPITRLLFQRGEFTQSSTMITATALAFYAIGLGAYGLNKFLALCFNSLHDTATPVKISALALLLNIILNTLFVVVLKTKIAGLAFASSLSSIASSLLLYNILHKRISQIESKRIMFELIKMLISGLIMGGVIFIIWHKLSAYKHHALSLFITICLGMCVYILLSFFLKVYQATHIFKWILRKR